MSSPGGRSPGTPHYFYPTTAGQPQGNSLFHTLSALQALTSNQTDKILQSLMNNFNKLTEKAKIILQWIPTHKDFWKWEGRPTGSRKEQPTSSLSCNITLIVNKGKVSSITKLAENLSTDDLKQLDEQSKTKLWYSAWELDTATSTATSRGLAEKPQPCACGEKHFCNPIHHTKENDERNMEP